jgi:hypothetical protein
MPTSKVRKNVFYLHHTRDRDGDVVFIFLDREHSGEEPVQSSPVTGIRRFMTATLDLKGKGNLSRYLITTQNTEYAVEMTRDRADHLAAELGGFLGDGAGS